MKMKLRLTPAKNVVRNKVVDEKKVSHMVFDWDESVKVRSRVSRKVQDVLIKKISIFDHNLVLNRVEHRLISAVSKSRF